MEFKQAVVTQNGRALMAKLLAGKSTQFTKIKVSSTIYPDAQLANLTALTNIKQETTAQAYGNNTATVSVVGAIENTGLSTGYYINTVGLYAMDPDKGEILYSVSSASVNGYMPPDTGVSKSGFEFKIYTEVGNATKVDLTVDPAAFATHEDIERLAVHQGWMMGENGEGFSDVKQNENIYYNPNGFGMAPSWNSNVCQIDTEETYNGFPVILATASVNGDWEAIRNRDGGRIRVDVKLGDKVTFSIPLKNIGEGKDGTKKVLFAEYEEYNTESGSRTTNGAAVFNKEILSDWNIYKSTYTIKNADTKYIDVTIKFVSALAQKTKVKIGYPKLEFGDVATPINISRVDDPINCYPKYVGFGIKSSDNYQDYRWILNPEWVNANAMYGTSIVTMKDQLADIQDWIQAHS
ncbi:hypothetical protein P7G51_08200 [Enterococcus asini]|uniref:hypothetical protein n=1 Tax=Enterococcus asini TaxID=57732 RepID=UPI00288F1CE6|nr:hypothetical protein [Enterococcus asini]MDT2757361.1 hypothetical protein [Enterococcus asini]